MTLKEVKINKVVVLQVPTAFSAVGAFYEDFSQVGDEEVIEIMNNYNTNRICDYSGIFLISRLSPFLFSIAYHFHMHSHPTDSIKFPENQKSQ